MTCAAIFCSHGYDVRITSRKTPLFVSAKRLISRSFARGLLSVSGGTIRHKVTCLTKIGLMVRRASILFAMHYFCTYNETRSSADADNRLDAFSGQSRPTNMVPFHMLHIISYCAIVILCLRRAVFTIFDFKKCRDLEIGVKGHWRSLRVISFDRLCMVSY